VLINSVGSKGGFATAVVFVDLDTQRPSAQIAKKMQTLLIIVLITVAAIITLIILLLNVYLFMPICSILRIIRERAGGNTSVFAKIFRHDEIGSLAMTLNDLMQIGEEREQELQLIFDNVPVNIWYKDNKNTLLRLNESAAKLIGKPVTDIEGKNLSQFLPQLADHELQEDQLIIESGVPSLNIIEKHIVDNEPRWTKTDKVPYTSFNHNQQRILVVKQDITELIKAEEKLRESEQRFQLVIKATYDGIWDWPDMSKDIEYWSPQWKALLGYEEHEIEASAKTFFSMLHPDDIAEVQNAVMAHQEQNIPFDVEYRLKNNQGDYRWFQAKGIMSTNAETGAKRMTGSISDIQQRKESEQKLRSYNAELERSNKILDEYAYAASHDLQSPLRGIDQIARWIIEDLAEGNTESITENLTLMRGRVKRMEKLLKDLLVYSKVGRQEESIGVVNTEELVYDLFKLASAPSGHQLIVENELPTFTTLVAPFEQVLRNLIGNAIKHNDKDDLMITISCRTLQNQYRFTVQDNGAGIDKKYHELIFKMFKSLKSRDEVEASGIGLTLVSKIIATYHGTIHLESDLGTGAKFSFTWPIDIKSLDNEQPGGAI
jgi:PAS domain S-box-containing protein